MKFFQAVNDNKAGVFLRVIDNNDSIRFFKKDGHTAISAWTLLKLKERIAKGNYEEINEVTANELLEHYGFPKYKRQEVKKEKVIVEEVIKLEKIKIGNLE